ncbi:peptidoglycan DD-metalloendopeptidase family protein [Pleionea sediminis]|uniref:peptidoglycan DD-metalloendopeptidase family protein n=1 Tax=Pleionea sediminis TaxID=2569479 RepID=UPI0011871629|nr:peptidoglycan DD-metalloendopeptidase family protein [Pleionea sediminis]
MKKLITIGVSLFCGLVYSEDLLTNYDTYFKKTTEQSSDLPDSSKCQVPANTLMSTKSISSSGVHFKVTLQNNLSGCSFLTGYFYQPHVDREQKLITVTANTVFKKHRIDSSQLPPEEKCSVTPGVYAAQDNVPTAESSHYYVNLKELLTNCGFSQGYFWEGHTQKGSMAIQITQNSVFKTEPKQSSELPSSEKCSLPIGVYALGADASTSGETHYEVTLATDLEGCDFKSGFVYYDHTAWKKPYVEPAEPAWAFPLPSGYYTSGWCVCRNIGTSPHIGQDISRSGTKKAVAVQEGRMKSTTYSSTCGYISYVEDDFGTLWRYVHLNQPQVSSGSRVSSGQLLAYISQYPRSGCGSGPHLHFERRSAGYFNDRATGKSCQNGYRSCYYDPIKPWRSNFSSKNIERESKLVKTNWSKLDTLHSAECKIPVEKLNRVSRKRFNQFKSEQDDAVVVDFSLHRRLNKADVFDSKAYVVNNDSNQCAKDQRCLIQWQLVAEAADGKLTSIFFHNRVRNIPLVREVEEQQCVPDNAIQYWMLLKDNRGKQWKVALNN